MSESETTRRPNARFLNLTELPDSGWSVRPIAGDQRLGSGRVIRVRIEGRPDQVATIVVGTSEGWCRVYLPETDEYVDAVVKWACDV